MPNSTNSESFIQYLRRVLRKAWESSGKWIRDKLFIPVVWTLLQAVIAFYLFHTRPNITTVEALISLNSAAFLLLFLVNLVLAPWKLDKERYAEIEELKQFKKSIEEKRVRLRFDRFRAWSVMHRSPDPSNPFILDWPAIALRATFTNPLASLPGKIAENVLAKITYTDQEGKKVSQFGRWAESTQPERLHPLESKNPLLPMDFLPGAEHELDIATKPPHSNECWAVSNNSFPKVLIDSQKLNGQVIHVLIELTAENVQERFELSFYNLGVNRGFGQIVNSEIVEINSN